MSFFFVASLLLFFCISLRLALSLSRSLALSLSPFVVLLSSHLINAANGEMDPALTLATRAKAVAGMPPDPEIILDSLLILPGSPDMKQYEDCREPLRKLFVESLPLRVLRAHYLYRCAKGPLLARCLNCPKKVRCHYEAAFESGKLVYANFSFLWAPEAPGVLRAWCRRGRRV